MWNIEEFQKKKRDILNKIKNCTDEQEKEKLEITLASYISMINNCGTIRNTKFYNLMDKVTKGNFSLIRPSTRYICNVGKIVYSHKDYMDRDYLSFLLQLMRNVLNTKPVIEDESELCYVNVPLSNDELLKISKLFYKSLGDEEIYQNAKRVIDDKDATNFSDTYSDTYSEAGGITFFDYIDGKAFCTTKRNNNVFDLQACNHEIMHGVDFYFNAKLPIEIYYGFHEIPTYTMDYLFIDYLEKIGFDSDEVQKLRKQKDAYLQGLAIKTNAMIQSQIVSRMGLGYLARYTVDDVIEILNPIILRNFLEIQSGVIAYGLHKQLMDNYELGLSNLKTLMNTKMSKDKRPNFSNIGLSDEEIEKLSMEIGSYSKEHESIENKIIK